MWATSIEMMKPGAWSAVCAATLGLALCLWPALVPAAGAAVGPPEHLANIRRYHFDVVTTASPLAQNFVTTLAQTPDGFLWVGTQGGLHRFDGYNFVLYDHDPEDPASLADGFVSAVGHDHAGALVVASGRGNLQRLGRNGESFEPVGDPAMWADRGTIGGIVGDPDGSIWVGSSRGVERIDSAGRGELRFADPDWRLDLVVPRALVRTPDGELIAAVAEGVIGLGPSDATPRSVARGIPRVLSLHIAPSGTVWIGTIKGLYRVDRKEAPTLVWPPEDSTDVPINGIAATADGHVWLTLGNTGMVRLDPDTGSVEHFRHSRSIEGSLPEDGVRQLLLDRGGILWVGGESRGLIRVDPRGARFTLITDENPDLPYVATNSIRSLAETPEGVVWIGTDGDGLKRLDMNTGRFEYFTNQLRAISMAGAESTELRVNAIAPRADGHLWLASNRGMLQLDPGSGKASVVWPIASGPQPEDPHARATIIETDGRAWIGTWANGLVFFDPASSRETVWRHDPTDADSLSHDSVLSLHRDRQGRLWIGTFAGLDRLDPATGRITRMPRAGTSATAPAGDIVRAVLESADGTLWFASHGGLSRLTPDQQDVAMPAFERWTPRNGLPANVIYGILSATSDRLWLSTNRGLVLMDVSTGEFRRYDVDDGLQDLEFNGGAALALADGRLAFGGRRGLNFFDPGDEPAVRAAAPLVLRRLRIGSTVMFPMNAADLPALRFTSSMRDMSIRSAVLDYTAPQRNTFEYRLDGMDNAWIPTGSRIELLHRNLPPGDHRIRIRGFDSQGNPAANQLEIPFSVETEWWRSETARILAALALMLVLAAIAYSVHARLRGERAHAAALREREERLRVAIWGSGDEFWDWDMRAGKLFRIGADNLLGSAHEDTIDGDEWRRSAVHPDDLDRVERVLAEHVRGERDAFESEHRVRRADGQYIWVRSRGRIVERDARGQPLRVAGTARDITATRAAERERRIAEQVLRSMSEAVAVSDLEFRFAAANPAFSRMTGYTQEEILGVSTAVLNCDQHDDEFYAALVGTVRRTGRWSGEIWQRRKDGDDFLCWLELSEVTDGAGDRTHYVAVLTDITDRKRTEQELRYLANYDALTGLPNRTLLGERLAHALIRARRQGTRVALLFIDLDRFKHVNDSLGHAAGDRLLKAAAARITGSIRDDDTVARLGGDEFTIVIEDLLEISEAESAARKLIDAFLAPLDIDGRTEVVISPSIGISIYPDHGQVPTDLLKYADTAMYRAKDHGRNTFEVYSPALDTRARWRAGMVSQLHKALDRHEFSIVYQPKLSLSSGRMTGVEALLRWSNAELGAVAPSTFIPLAEETGLIVPIGEWVLREALSELRRWERAGVGDVSVAVNVSMLQLLRGDLPTLLRQAVAQSHVRPDRIVLELTESMVMANAEQSITTLRALKDLGISIAIDDFGTGYSSLSQLKRLPIDTLKIDKAFVGDITIDADDEAITSTVITMAHSLGLEVIAEGVETREQLEYLRERGCDEIQGFLVSRPLPGDSMLEFLLRSRAQVDRTERADG
jgi:diguanylate cyclase (GGDEF)-like protein/PAS domain S-box-containing protein